MTKKKVLDLPSSDSAPAKKSQTTPDRYTVLILYAINQGKVQKKGLKDGHTGKIKKVTEIASNVGQETTNASFQAALRKCEADGYTISFSTKKERLKIFHPHSSGFFNYSGPCQELTKKGIEMVNAINSLANEFMDEIIHTHITSQKNLSDEKISEYLEICKGIPNQFKILSELGILSTE